MGYENDEALFARIPRAAAALLRRALVHGDARTAHELAQRALAAVAFPEGNVYPTPDELRGDQRAVAEILARHDGIELHPFALPGVGEARRRWLGLEPGGALETTLVRGVPLWRALQECGLDRARAGAILDALPMETALLAIGEMFPAAYGLQPAAIVARGRLRLWTDLRGEGRAWAIEQAHKWSALALQRTPRQAPEELKALVFLALVRAGVGIDPAWDVLLPGGAGVHVLEECVAALPEARRGPAIVAALERLRPEVAVPRGLALLERLPSAVLAEAILQHAERPGAPPKRGVVERLRAVAAKYPIVAQALASEPPPVELRCAEYMKPRSIEDLTDVQRRQLELAGRAFDGRDLPAAARLAEDGGEDSFAGLVQFRSIVDASGAPAYDAVLYMGDMGTIFTAGTTEVAGAVVRGAVDAADRALAAALGGVLYAPAPMSQPRLPAPKRRRASKPKPAPKAKAEAPEPKAKKSPPRAPAKRKAPRKKA